MITKKCAISLGCLAATLTVCLICMHVMSLFSVSQWVGVGAGAGLTAIALILAISFRKNYKIVFAVIPLNAVAEGLAASSLFVYVGSFPQIWESAEIFGVMCLTFFLYVLLTNFTFFRNRYVLCMSGYTAVILAGLITGAALTKSNVFYLALLMTIPFIAFLVVMVCRAPDAKKHLQNMTCCSFAAAILVIIAVLAVLSQGEILNGAVGGGADDVGKSTKPKRNPYDFYASI